MDRTIKKQAIIDAIKAYCGEGGRFYFEHGFDWKNEPTIYKGAVLTMVADDVLHFKKIHKRRQTYTWWKIKLNEENFTLPQLKKVISVIDDYEKHIEKTEGFTMDSHISDYLPTYISIYLKLK